MTYTARQVNIVLFASYHRWSNVDENLFATTGRPGNHINVYHMEHHKVSFLKGVLQYVI